MLGPSKVGLCAAARARQYLGVSEQPPGSNRGPLIDAWNEAAGVPVGSPWCMSFAHAMFKACGVELGGWASVGNFVTWTIQHGYLTERPWRGCLVTYDWNADDWADHVEIVDRVLALRWRGGRFVGYIRTTGGNTGDAVSTRWRWATSTCRFARIPDLPAHLATGVGLDVPE